jgi:arylsulfatase A-like enzyme
LLYITNTLYAQTSRPNIVLIHADDLGYNDLSCYGSQINKSPNIDQLAAKRMKYTDFYASAPICSQSRAGLLTGKYPISMGIQNVFFSRKLVWHAATGNYHSRSIVF